MPLTPEQIEKAAATYARTGNYAEAARSIGAAETAVRKRLREQLDADRNRLHARATNAGLRRGRKMLADVMAMAHRILVVENGAGTGLEPRDFASIMNALSKANDALVNVADREDKRQANRIQRSRGRAELAALRAAGATGGDLQVVVQIAPPKPTE